MNDLIYLYAKRLYAAKSIELDPKDITPTEKRIFDLVLRVVNDYNTGTTLRVAGGWVRDKLLGKDSKDIDFAIDNMSGEKFARLVNKWMKEHGMDTRSVGVIKANPDQSKHLETATTYIFDLPIDFAGLRSETYAEGSRIPVAKTGTPEEDAYRRDLTINSLFYNVNTGKIEDITGRGIEDLEKGVIRTPLDPTQTFKDDPLRILRAIRFASRYGFDIDPDLIEAAQQPEIQQALTEKVTRERMGEELKKMMKGKDPAGALHLIKDWGLRDTVFKTPAGLKPWDMDQRNPYHELLLWDHLVKVVETMNKLVQDKKVEGDERIILLLAAFLHDIGKLDPGIIGEKEVEGQMVATYHGHEESSKRIAEHLLKELKLSNKEIQNVLDLIAPAGRAETLTREMQKGKDPTRKSLAKFVRMIGDKWRHAVYLAMADDASKRREGVDTSKWELYQSLMDSVEKLDVQKAHEWKPLLNGHEVMQLLGIKPGPQLGEVMSSLMEWQMEYPGATKEDASRWVLSNFGHLRTAFPLTLKLRKTGATRLEYDHANRYVFYPVEKPEYEVPEGLNKRGHFHITVISPDEVPYIAKLARKRPEDLFGELYVETEPEFVGLGRQTEGDNEVYFVVVNWPEAQAVRDAFGLPPKDFHITIGYTEEDIHGVPKDETTLIDHENI